MSPDHPQVRMPCELLTPADIAFWHKDNPAAMKLISGMLEEHDRQRREAADVDFLYWKAEEAERRNAEAANAKRREAEATRLFLTDAAWFAKGSSLTEEQFIELARTCFREGTRRLPEPGDLFF
jgi:hypothetical protein